MKENSKFNFRKQWEDYAWLRFVKNAEKAASEKQLAEFLDYLVSESEKRIIVKRITTLSLIKAGKSYKEIGRILWISPKTISALKKSVIWHNGYKSSYYYSKKSGEEKRKKIKSLPPRTIFDYWLNMPLPKKTGRGRWKFLYYQG